MQHHRFLEVSGGTSVHQPSDSPIGTAGEVSPERPNVLFVAVDDLNDWVGVLGGHPQAKTPNIDNLARRSFLFERAYCPVPYCLASRVAVLTGVAPYHSGVYRKQKWRHHLPDAVTIPRQFRAHGYKTFGIGKIIEHSIKPSKVLENDPEAWDYYVDSGGSFKATGRPFSGFKRVNLSGHLPRIVPDSMDWKAVQETDLSRWRDGRAAEYVRNLLSQAHTHLLFLACGFRKPHLPWYLPKSYFDPFPLSKIQIPVINENDLDDTPRIARNWAWNSSRWPFFLHWVDGRFWKTVNRGYDHMIRDTKQQARAVQGYLAASYFLDEMLGRVLEGLDTGPNRDNTIVVLWSDHGWHLGEKLAWSKFTLWEEANRVPYIYRVPERYARRLPGFRPKGRCKTPVSTIDTFATLCDLSGIPQPSGIDSRSLGPLLADPTCRWDRPAISTWLKGNHSVRFKELRYTRYRNGSEELYDHAQDPMEWNNKAGDPSHLELKKQLQSMVLG